ncbi:MAG: pilus assembly protein PilM, partial [Nitrospirae bacterium]|nr:pilus assembly protein PilM [Nitrospirota bacterium]
MARKIAAIDIGSHSVKVVLARERLGKIEPLRFFERPLTNGNVQELIRSILQEGGLHPDVVVSSVPGNTVSVHYLNVPFTDEAKIGQVIPYEVEGLVPFPLEEMVIDQFILSKGNGAKPDNGSSVCVGLIKKSELQRHMDTLKGASVDAKVIEIESLALYHAFMQWYKIEDTAALLDIGAARSNLCIVSKGKPQYVRTFNRGGSDITSAIQETLGLSFEEAEAKKFSSAIMLSTEGDDENSRDKNVPPIDDRRGFPTPSMAFSGERPISPGSQRSMKIPLNPPFSKG